MLYIADYKKFDVLNGTGIRHSLFVSGCSHKCENCWNKKTWNFKYGFKYTEEFEDRIILDLKNTQHKVRGISILGGCPACHPNIDYILPMLKRIRKECPNKDIWIWTGETYEELLYDDKKRELLYLCDVLIDGTYDHTKRNLKLKWRGSENQRVIDLKSTVEQNNIITLKNIW